MVSPLGPTSANIFLCYHESDWLKGCPKYFKPVYYKRFADDVFVLFNKLEHAQLFLGYINKKHKNMKFSIEIEINGSLSSLDVKTFLETISLLLVFLEKIRLVGYTLISSVFFHLSTSLAWYTSY